GLVVAILFCFMNGEVQSEILKRVCRRRPYNHYLRYYRSARCISRTKLSVDRAQSAYMTTLKFFQQEQQTTPTKILRTLNQRNLLQHNVHEMYDPAIFNGT
ncbi:Hypothetical predicted protein, partial [Mytilus galloprovincialis]